MGALAFALRGMEIVSMMATVGMQLAEIKSFADGQKTKVKDFMDTHRNPSEQDWSELNAVRDQVHAKFQEKAE